MIELKDLYAGYSKKDVLKNINMRFEKGEIVSIIGPNGSGKSTLIQCCAGLLNNANNLSIKIRFTQSKKSNRIFGRKHLTLMREFGTRSRPSLNDRYRLFQA